VFCYFTKVILWWLHSWSRFWNHIRSESSLILQEYFSWLISILTNSSQLWNRTIQTSLLNGRIYFMIYLELTFIISWISVRWDHLRRILAVEITLGFFLVKVLTKECISILSSSNKSFRHFDGGSKLSIRAFLSFQDRWWIIDFHQLWKLFLRRKNTSIFDLR
jgi:hypothetical protein